MFAQWFGFWRLLKVGGGDTSQKWLAKGRVQEEEWLSL